MRYQIPAMLTSGGGTFSSMMVSLKNLWALKGGNREQCQDTLAVKRIVVSE
jgi:hypothetical protein